MSLVEPRRPAVPTSPRVPYGEPMGDLVYGAPAGDIKQDLALCGGRCACGGSASADRTGEPSDTDRSTHAHT